MKFIITILEDTKKEREHLSEILDIWSQEKNFVIEKKIYNSVESYLRTTEIPKDNSNLFILDIQMGQISGIVFAHRLRSEGFSGHIIFLTAFREYVFHGYEVHAFNFLLKPVDVNALYKCLDEVSDTLAGHFYCYRNKSETLLIPHKDILCFSSVRHSIEITTTSGLYIQYAALNNIINFLPRKFVRVHKSHIVNLAHIYKINGNIISLSNQLTLEIGPSYFKQVHNAFASYTSRFDSF